MANHLPQAGCWDKLPVVSHYFDIDHLVNIICLTEPGKEEVGWPFIIVNIAAVNNLKEAETVINHLRSSLNKLEDRMKDKWK